MNISLNKNMLTFSLNFGINLYHKNFLNLNFRLRKNVNKNLETRC